MKIALIGTGNMASGLAQQLAKADHSLVISGRNSAKAQELARSVRATARNEAPAAHADIVILATPYANAVDALKAAGDLTDKIVIDITNPLTADYMGLTVGHNTSAAEEIQKEFPQAKIVKAFNTVFAQILAAGPELAGETAPVFYAGDHAQAKEKVKALIDSIGFKAVDAGPLKNARYLEPLAGLNIYFGYGAGHGTAIAPNWIGMH